MTATDPATAHTLEFVLGAFRGAGAAHAPRVLEIGCGSGELAAALGATGARVVGVDPNPDAVLEATKRGVEAEAGYWPAISAVLGQRGPFDAVLFTRSLHHIHEMDEALEAAAAALTDRGVLVIEDFAYQEATPSDAQWIRSILDVLSAAGLNAATESISPATPVIDWWRRDHDHDLHAWPLMEAAVRKVFHVLETNSTPYLFRYVHEALRSAGSDPQKCARITKLVLEHERRRQSELDQSPVGRRLLARQLD